MTSKITKSARGKPCQYDGAVGLDGEQLGDMCIRLVDDIVYNQFQFYYKGKPEMNGVRQKHKGRIGNE